MLPSLGFQEILLLGVLALVVIGPKDLPLLLRKLGRWTARLRGMAQEFRTGFDELARQAELDELKKEVEALRRTTNLSSLANEITKPFATLEDYAGLSKPAPASPQPVASRTDSKESWIASDPGAGAGGGGSATPPDEPRAAQPSLSHASPPQSAPRADSSPIEGEQAPLARSAP